MFQRITLYTAVCLFIGTWWFLAFPSTLKHCEDLVSSAEPAAWRQSTQVLAPLERTELEQALRGDVTTMGRLLNEWDSDAELLKAAGVPGVQRLSKAERLEAQTLLRQLLYAEAESLELERQRHCQGAVVDDQEIPHQCKGSSQRFLPQTFVSAQVLLALVDKEQIVALPAGMRDQEQLIPTEISRGIPLDADRYQSEKLYLAQADLAFVASYSQPSCCEVLRKQGTELFTLDELQTVPDILDGIERVGKVCGRPLKARLMVLFLRSAMLSMDNRLLAQRYVDGKLLNLPRVLYLHYYNAYSVPTGKTLNARLLSRLGVVDLVPEKTQSLQWSMPITREEIIRLQPDCLIIASSPDFVLQEAAFRDVPAIRQQRVYAVDVKLQDDPSQLFLMAYFDLWSGLMEDLQKS